MSKYQVLQWFNNLPSSTLPPLNVMPTFAGANRKHKDDVLRLSEIQNSA
jgi:hypothetical protein